MIYAMCASSYISRILPFCMSDYHMLLSNLSGHSKILQPTKWDATSEVTLVILCCMHQCGFLKVSGDKQ